VREEAIKNKQALINQVLTNTIKKKMDKKDGRQRTRISREEINTLMHIHFYVDKKS
jgi:hypothetical protein